MNMDPLYKNFITKIKFHFDYFVSELAKKISRCLGLIDLDPLEVANQRMKSCGTMCHEDIQICADTQSEEASYSLREPLCCKKKPTHHNGPICVGECQQRLKGAGI